MGSGFSLPTIPFRWWLSGSRQDVDIAAESPFESISDEELKALLDNLDLNQGNLGLSDEPAIPVWRIAPDTVLKYVAYDGSEPFTMHLVSSQTSIPVPKVRRCISWRSNLCIFMDYVEGHDLEDVWPSLSIWSRFKVAWVLRGYIRQLRKVKLPHQVIPGPINALGPTPLKCMGHYFPDISAGPFPSYAALTAWYDGRRRLTNLFEQSYIEATGGTYKESPQVYFDDSLPLVLTHADINPRNVRLGSDGKVWLMDWDRAGMYPQWFEYASIMAYSNRKTTPRGWLWFAPFIAGWYKSQLSFMHRYACGIQHYGFEGFD